MPDVPIVIKATDRFSDAMKTMRDSSTKFSKDIVKTGAKKQSRSHGQLYRSIIKETIRSMKNPSPIRA